MSEAAALATNLARNCGYAVFPCRSDPSPKLDKRPSWSKAQGGKGFHDASIDPAEIARLFRHPHAHLIGVRTGAASGVSVLDVDVKHDEARAWWIQNVSRLPITRTYRTKSGGLHLYFQHADCVRNSEGIPVKGIDTRGEGGYVIHWFAAGFECVDHTPAAAWPNWLTTFFWPPPPAKFEKSRRRDVVPDDQYETIKQRAIDRVAAAGDGEKHNRLRSSAKLLGGIQERAGFTDADAIEWLAGELGLEGEKKACETVKWGLAKGRAVPLDLARS